MNKCIFLYNVKFLGILFIILGINELPVAIILLKDNFFAMEELIWHLQLVSRSIPYILFGLFLVLKTKLLFRILVLNKFNKSESKSIEYSLVGISIIIVGIYFSAKALMVAQFFIAEIMNISVITLTSSVLYLKISTVIFPLLVVYKWKNVANLILNNGFTRT